jgi:hypothetical protein
MHFDWVQSGILGMAAVANLLVMAGIISKNSKAMGELTATTEGLSDTIKKVGGDMQQLYDSRFDHERRLTELETEHRGNHNTKRTHIRRKADQAI